jgi:hypothetical protein
MMSKLKLARISLLAADVVAHLAGFAQARRDEAPLRDQFGMLGGAAAYKVLAVGVAAGHPVAEKQAVTVPLGGIVALLATWTKSGVPALTRVAIIGIDLGLVATGIAASREAAATAAVSAPVPA